MVQIVFQLILMIRINNGLCIHSDESLQGSHTSCTFVLLTIMRNYETYIQHEFYTPLTAKAFKLKMLKTSKV